MNYSDELLPRPIPPTTNLMVGASPHWVSVSDKNFPVPVVPEVSIICGPPKPTEIQPAHPPAPTSYRDWCQQQQQQANKRVQFNLPSPKAISPVSSPQLPQPARIASSPYTRIFKEQSTQTENAYPPAMVQNDNFNVPYIELLNTINAQQRLIQDQHRDLSALVACVLQQQQMLTDNMLEARRPNIAVRNNSTQCSFTSDPQTPTSADGDQNMIKYEALLNQVADLLRPSAPEIQSTSDKSVMVNALAKKYLPDIQKNYNAHAIIDQINSKPSNGERFLDVTAIKNQPKLL